MRILITGGGGYVGSALVPELLKLGHEVTVFDTFWFMKKPFKFIDDHNNLNLVFGDIRDEAALVRAGLNQDAMIHLACVSNDPCFELNPNLGKEINYDAFKNVLACVRKNNLKRFIYASSSSVYGVREEENVTEDSPCTPLTDYSKYKLECELDLKKANLNTCWTIIRPATVCGFSQRLRLDLSVNILTINALVQSKITVHGGNQRRPNLNIRDMVAAYIKVLTAAEPKIYNQTFNVGYDNKTILEIANMVKHTLHDRPVRIEVKDVVDNRSYHINSDKFNETLNFWPTHSIQNAVHSIKSVYEFGFLNNPLENANYFNIKRMKELGLT